MLEVVSIREADGHRSQYLITTSNVGNIIDARYKSIEHRSPRRIGTAGPSDLVNCSDYCQTTVGARNDLGKFEHCTVAGRAGTAVLWYERSYVNVAASARKTRWQKR